LIYCLENGEGGVDAAAQQFAAALAGKHREVIEKALGILRKRFTDDDKTEGYLKDGPVALARFELGKGTEPAERDLRELRQRQASDVVTRFLAKLEEADGPES
jgi:hypothetical protein